MEKEKLTYSSGIPELSTEQALIKNKRNDNPNIFKVRSKFIIILIIQSFKLQKHLRLQRNELMKHC